MAVAGRGAEFKTISAEVEKALLGDVDKELKAFGGNQSVPGAVVGVWMPGAAPWVRAVGLGNLTPREAMKIDDKFRVGSNTKTFVVTVLLQLVDEGKLSLDDSLAKFDLGVKVPNAEHITVLRMVVKENFSRDMVDLLAHDVRASLRVLKDGPSAGFRRAAKRPVY